MITDHINPKKRGLREITPQDELEKEEKLLPFVSMKTPKIEMNHVELNESKSFQNPVKNITQEYFKLENLKNFKNISFNQTQTFNPKNETKKENKIENKNNILKEVDKNVQFNKPSEIKNKNKKTKNVTKNFTKNETQIKNEIKNPKLNLSNVIVNDNENKKVTDKIQINNKILSESLNLNNVATKMVKKKEKKMLEETKSNNNNNNINEFEFKNDVETETTTNDKSSDKSKNVKYSTVKVLLKSILNDNLPEQDSSKFESLLKHLMTKVVKSIKKTFTDSEKRSISIGFGNWTKSKAMKGCLPAPNIKVKMKLIDNFEVVHVDEFRTSKLCNDCKSDVLFKCQLRENRKQHIENSDLEPKKFLVHGLLACNNCSLGRRDEIVSKMLKKAEINVSLQCLPNCKCSELEQCDSKKRKLERIEEISYKEIQVRYNRDRNAARNILYLFTNHIHNLEIEEIFQRSFKIEKKFAGFSI